MTLLRSGLVLYVSVTVLAALILGALLMATGNIGGLRLDLSSDWSFLWQLSIVTLPTSVLLAVLAWRGRQQPVADGVALMSCVAIVVCLVFYLVVSFTPQQYSGYEIVIWIFAGMGLAVLIPAYLISYLALRRTPLLKGIAPPRNGRVPAETGR